ncbi:RyR domain-containing protein [Phytohabitans aurantiacus]|uniref:RCK N-terminal domain-containing protein n=1 Tax=Phytohabitans aurantiacus TaxID=3016789 RepID=A0ABQ5QNJ3_9ACTN|nr:RyR domain-containing protein [Phytohabitans aurantiacus]GLH95809.1 hypothetical protein Pa4123_10810 [Phytohabitans aurantiacus]
MAQPNDPTQHRPAINALRLGITVTAVVSLLLGYLGLDAFLSGSDQYGNRPIDLLYYDVQLFVLGADPLQQPGPYPLLLEIARLTAPLATITALVEAARLLFATELRRLRARRARGHVIVCGDTSLAGILSRRLHAAGRRVVHVRAQAEAVPPSPSYPLIVVGDARDAGTLTAAGLSRATALYACAHESATNIAIGLAAGRERRLQGPSLPIYTHVPDPDLCLTLQARYLGLPNPPGARLDFFNVDDLAARKVFLEDPLEPEVRPRQYILVAGTTPFGQALAVEAARHWRRRLAPDPSTRLRIAIVARNATETLANLAHRYPFLRLSCRLDAYDADLVDILATELDEAPDRAYICYANEERALKAALTADRYWRGRKNCVVVRLDQLADFSDDGGLASQLLDDGPARLRVYGVLRAACDPGMIAEDLVERLARVIHDRYLVARRSHGQADNSSPSIVSWERLPPELRQTNRAQAEDIGRKLRAIGYVLVPRMRESADEESMNENEIERLAMMEHERWCLDRLAAGWRYGERRDDIRKLHPALCDWSNLPPDIRERNHDAVREVPLILSDAGFQLVRI